MTNHFLEQVGSQERVDHRSHVKRGLDVQPTIHEGVDARAMEKKGIISDRCELNRQIKADNALLRALKAQVKKLTELVKGGVAVVAETMENLRQRMIIFRYQVLHIGDEKARLSDTLQAVRPDLKRYEDFAKRLKATIQERWILLEENYSGDSQMLAQSRKDIANLPDEVAAPVSIREKLRQSAEQTDKQRHMNMQNQERQYSVALIRQIFYNIREFTFQYFAKRIQGIRGYGLPRFQPADR